jgi:hypothetical protein
LMHATGGTEEEDAGRERPAHDLLRSMRPLRRSIRGELSPLTSGS